MVKNALSLMVHEIFWVKVDQKKKAKKEACKCNVFVDWSTKTNMLHVFLTSNG